MPRPHARRSILNRPKRGFGVPLDRWFREDLRSYMDATLGARRLAREGASGAGRVDRILAEHDSRAAQPWARALDAPDARGVPPAGGLVNT